MRIGGSAADDDRRGARLGDVRAPSELRVRVRRRWHGVPVPSRDARWAHCRSPLRWSKRLGFGEHDFRVRAVVGEIADRTPATATFRVVPHEGVIGRSVDGRAIRAERFGDPASERKVLVVGSIHGDEPQGMRVIGRLRRHYAGASATSTSGRSPRSTRMAPPRHPRQCPSRRPQPQLRQRLRSGPHRRQLLRPARVLRAERRLRDLSRRIRPDLAIWYHQPGESADAVQPHP